MTTVTDVTPAACQPRQAACAAGEGRGIGWFMTQMMTRIRTRRDPSVRIKFCSLIYDLSIDTKRQPPYSHEAAVRMYNFIENEGLGEPSQLDFETVLKTLEQTAQARDEAERKKKEEWDIVKKEEVEAEEPWEMIWKLEAVRPVHQA